MSMHLNMEAGDQIYSVIFKIKHRTLLDVVSLQDGQIWLARILFNWRHEQLTFQFLAIVMFAISASYADVIMQRMTKIRRL